MLKNQWLFIDFASSRSWCQTNFTIQNCLKNEVTQIHRSLIDFTSKLDRFLIDAGPILSSKMIQNLLKINPNIDQDSKSWEIDLGMSKMRRISQTLEGPPTQNCYFQFWILRATRWVGLRKWSQNRSNLVQESIRKRTRMRLRIQTDFWIDFSLNFDQFFNRNKNIFWLVYNMTRHISNVLKC